MDNDSQAISIDVGQRIHELRGVKGLSQRALAQLCDLSPNALSQIERGNVSPTVSTLSQLAAALEVPITAFFEVGTARQEVVFIKADQRTRVPLARGLMEGLGGELFVGSVEPLYLTLESGGSSGPQAVTHTGHEFVFCLRGVLEYRVEQHYFELRSGDSLLFAAHLRHRWRNPGSVVTNALIIISGGEISDTRQHLAINAEEE